MRNDLIYLVFAIIYFTLGIVAACGRYDNPIFYIITVLVLIADYYIQRKMG